MEPAQPGSRYSQDKSAWNPPLAPPAPPIGPRSGGRIGLIVASAVVTALALIAAFANEWATKQMTKQHGEKVAYLNGWLSYSWRFTAGNWPTRYWAGQLALVGTALVLTGALVWCLLRGAVTWGRAFFGTWLAVLFATVVGAIVRGLIQPPRFSSLPGSGRVTNALFGVFGPTAAAVFGGLVLGLIVALVTALVAVLSRRPARSAARGWTPPGPPSFPDYAAPPASVSSGPPPWQDQHYGPPAGTSLRKTPADEPHRPAHAQPEAAPAAETTALPRVPDEAPPAGDQPTTRLAPPAEAEALTPAPTAPAGEQATTRFPRPPDDEQLGHIDH